jgi:hypothetical protein
VLLVLGTVLSKQNGMMLCLLFPLVLWLDRHPATAGWLFAKLAFGLTLVFGGMTLYYGGDVLWANLVLGLDNGINLPMFGVTVLDQAVKKFSPTFLLGGGLMLLAWRQPYLLRLPPRYNRFMGVSLLATLAFTLLSSLKFGATPSYFAEFNALVWIAGAQVLAAKRDRWQTSAWFPYILMLFCCLHILLNISGKQWGRSWRTKRTTAYQAEQQALRDWLLGQEDAPTSPSVLDLSSGLIYLYLPEYLLFPNPDIVHCCALPRGTYNYSTFWEGIENGMVRWVITDPNTSALHFMNRPLYGFKSLGVHQGYRIWRYQPGEVTREEH